MAHDSFKEEYSKAVNAAYVSNQLISAFVKTALIVFIAGIVSAFVGPVVEANQSEMAAEYLKHHSSTELAAIKSASTTTPLIFVWGGAMTLITLFWGIAIHRIYKRNNDHESS